MEQAVKLLIFDDTSSRLREYCQFFKDAHKDWIVRPVNTIQEAIKAVNEEIWDVILCDACSKSSILDPEVMLAWNTSNNRRCPFIVYTSHWPDEEDLQKVFDQADEIISTVDSELPSIGQAPTSALKRLDNAVRKHLADYDRQRLLAGFNCEITVDPNVPIDFWPSVACLMVKILNAAYDAKKQENGYFEMKDTEFARYLNLEPNTGYRSKQESKQLEQLRRDIEIMANGINIGKLPPIMTKK